VRNNLLWVYFCEVCDSHRFNSILNFLIVLILLPVEQPLIEVIVNTMLIRLHC